VNLRVGYVFRQLLWPFSGRCYTKDILQIMQEPTHKCKPLRLKLLYQIYVLKIYDSIFICSIFGVLIRSIIYRVIHKSLRECRLLRYSSRDGHVEGGQVNRGRDAPSFQEILYLLTCSFLLCLSWLLRSRVREFQRHL
jgi:hypothetical protein